MPALTWVRCEIVNGPGNRHRPVTDGLPVTVLPAAPTADVAGPSFDELVWTYDAVVRRTLRRVLGRHRDEDDLVQEVFLRLAIRLRQPGEVAVPAWVRRVARNVAIDELRRRHPDLVGQQLPEVVTDSAPVTDDPHCVLEGRELNRLVQQAVASLPARQRWALLGRLSDSATGAADDGPVTGGAVAGGAVTLTAEARHSLVARARRQLRRDLADSWRIGAVPSAVALATRGWVTRLLRRPGAGTRLSPARNAWRRAVAVHPVVGKVVALAVAGTLAGGASLWLAGGPPPTPGAAPSTRTEVRQPSAPASGSAGRTLGRKVSATPENETRSADTPAGPPLTAPASGRVSSAGLAFGGSDLVPGGDAVATGAGDLAAAVAGGGRAAVEQLAKAGTGRPSPATATGLLVPTVGGNSAPQTAASMSALGGSSVQPLTPSAPAVR